MNIWKAVPHHENPEEAYEQFCDRGVIAIGWSEVGDLSSHVPTCTHDITKLIRISHPTLKNSHLGGPSLWNFYSRMQPGDFVLTSSGGRRYAVFQVTGDYEFVDADAAILGYHHVRSAQLTGIDAEDLWVRCGKKAAVGHAVRWTLAMLSASDAAEEKIHEEGRRYSLTSTAIERNPTARRDCLAHYGNFCQVCGYDGVKTFGPTASPVIHVHHLTELASTTGLHKVDPISDLVPLCPNCHSMAHQRMPAYSLDELRLMGGY